MQIKNEPLVSVLMTAFNRQKYIADAIESVLASTYTNFELIIVDDGSKDNTVKIAQLYKEKNDKIRLYINEKNLGDYSNRNKAAGYAEGEFLMYVDSDDMILKDGIENCVAAMISFPNSNFGMYSPEKEKKTYQLVGINALKQHFFNRPFLMVGPGGTIIRRKFFEQIKGYPEKYGPANDMYFNLKVCCYSNLLMLPFEFLIYRRHEGQEINDSYSYLINNYLYFKDALEALPIALEKDQVEWLGNKNKRRFFVNILKFLFKTKDLKKTKEVLEKTGFGIQDALAAVFH